MAIPAKSTLRADAIMADLEPFAPILARYAVGLMQQRLTPLVMQAINLVHVTAEVTPLAGKALEAAQAMNAGVREYDARLVDELQGDLKKAIAAARAADGN